MAFPPEIEPKKRLTYGAAGIFVVLFVWWLVTLPVFTESVTRNVPVGAIGPDQKPRFEQRTETLSRALVNPPALDTPWNTLSDAWVLLTRSGPEPSLLEHILRSSIRILLGFLISALVAVPLGIAMALFPRLRATINPIISFLRPLPSIAWVPLAMIWLGAGEAQKLAIIFIGSFSAALIYTIEATIKVEPDLVRAGRNLGVKEKQLLWKVLLPAALPNILSGLKVVMAIGWTCVISAEIVGTQAGLGALIWSSMENSRTSAVLVGMVCISGVVLILDALIVRIEQRLLPWMFAERAK